MTELNYWTGNLVAGDDVFFQKDGALTLSVITGCTRESFSISGIEAKFDKATAQTDEGIRAVAYTPESREQFLSQHKRMWLESVDEAKLSDSQVSYMLAALDYVHGFARAHESPQTKRERLRKLDLRGLSDTDIAYILAGLNLAEKSERIV